jgi:MOSC domain-containing protein YiiM
VAAGCSEGRVLALCTSHLKGTQKHAVDAVELLAGVGIVGDAHAGPGHRQVSLLAEEQIDGMRRRGLALEPGAFAENIVTAGIDLDALEVGDALALGENAVLEVTQRGKECHTHCAIHRAAGDCIMPRVGVFARVLHGGIVRPGDRIARLPRAT